LFTDDQLSCDGFLGGRLALWQPRAGYRAGVDPVLLAAAVAAKPGESVLELGCGAGAAMLCLAARVPGLAGVVGVEGQPLYADLARRNAAKNGIDVAVVTADVAALPADLRGQSFDHVIANPPYFLRAHSTASPRPIREAAMGEVTPLGIWVDVAARRLRHRGLLTMIQNAARLPDLLGAIAPRLGSIRVLPIAPRHGRPAGLVIVQARKGGRAEFALLAPLIMHEGARHLADGDSYTPQLRAILREGAALDWPA